MKTGMMWFDNNPKIGMSAKIERAVDYYCKKYGANPNLCLVNPGALASKELAGTTPSGVHVTVRAWRAVLPGHLWIGIEENN